MFELEKNVPYKADEKERENALSTAIAKFCLEMRANDSFLISKDKFKSVKWNDEKSKYNAKVYTRKCITDRIVNSKDYKIQIQEGGIRVWYKPKEETILPILKVKKVEEEVKDNNG